MLNEFTDEPARKNLKPGLVAVGITAGLFVVIGCVALILARKPAEAARPAAVASSVHPASGGLPTKASFRQMVRSFPNPNGPRPWDGLNGQGGRNGYHVGGGIMRYDRVTTRLAKDFINSFGPPQNTSTEGDIKIWSWPCADGTIEVVFQEYRSGVMAIISIDDH